MDAQPSPSSAAGAGDPEAGGGAAQPAGTDSKKVERAATVMADMDREAARQVGKDGEAAVRHPAGRPVMAYGKDGKPRALEVSSDSDDGPDYEEVSFAEDRYAPALSRLCDVLTVSFPLYVQTREPYYWEDGYTGEEPGVPTQVWHTTHWLGYKGFLAAEFMGEVVADFFGLNQSKYQWVLDQLERDREREEARKREEAELEELARLQEMAERLELAEKEGDVEAGEADDEGADDEGADEAAA